MIMTTYKLDGITIYPQSIPVGKRGDKRKLSENWYVLPGKRLIHVDELKRLAKVNGLRIVEERYPVPG